MSWLPKRQGYQNLLLPERGGKTFSPKNVRFSKIGFFRNKFRLRRVKIRNIASPDEGLGLTDPWVHCMLIRHMCRKQCIHNEGFPRGDKNLKLFCALCARTYVRFGPFYTLQTASFHVLITPTRAIIRDAPQIRPTFL